jgi:glutamyl-tRNA synthetase
VLRALQAPHQGEDEPIYPGTCRPPPNGKDTQTTAASTANAPVDNETRINWRFRVPDGEIVSFVDGNFGRQRFLPGKDFGDFIVWRHDDLPSYQLAVVVDDALMQITEVVRGEDLLRSTARQLLLYRAFGWNPPAFYHCTLVTDEKGMRLAKRHDSLSLRTLRAKGAAPPRLRESWQ